MIDSDRPFAHFPDDQLHLVDAACSEFEQAIQNGHSVSIEQQIERTPGDLHGILLRELLAIEFEFWPKEEAAPELRDFLQRFPDFGDEVRQAFVESNLLELSLSARQKASSDAIAFETVGSKIEAYTLREQIGEGGMGLVFVAEQEKPVRRTVAIKIIKPGLDSKEVVARFEAERQALAMMDHPSIARVLDAGVTDAGRPFFVMELIRGIPVTEFCDQRKLPTRSRLELFVEICHAVQHSHQKGIIHRDLKPSNILVTLNGDTPLPKVIDFGVAKAINQRLTEKTIYTQMSQLVGTPLFMSPEQAELSAVDVDTRTDIYSLGVILYELVTGVTPFSRERLSDIGYDEMRRIIREEEPPRPSQQLSSLDAEARSEFSQRRGADVPRLAQVIRGELDWIIMKSLEKDRSRRYATANDFAADVCRFLADEPVLACPPSTVYRVRKYLRRNRVAVTIASLLMVGTLTLLAGLATSNFLITRQWNEAEKAKSEETSQRLRADRNFRLARQSVDKYFKLVSETTLLDQPGLHSLRKELMGNAVDFYESQLQPSNNDPEVIIELTNTRLRLAVIYFLTNDLESMLDDLEKSFDEIDRTLEKLPPTSDAYRNLSGFWSGYRSPLSDVSPSVDVRSLSYSVDRQQRELEVLERGIAIWRRLCDARPDEVSLKRELAFFLNLKMNHHAHFGPAEDEAETRNTIIDILEKLVSQNPDDAALVAELGIIVAAQGIRDDDAIRLSEGARLMEKANLPSLQRELAICLQQLGWRHLSNKEPEKAIEPFQRGIEMYKELAGQFPYVDEYELYEKWYLPDLAQALKESGRESDALKMADDINPRTGSDFVVRGNIYRAIRKDAEAIADYDEALALGLKGKIPDIGRVGNFLDSQRQHQKAISFYTHGIETRTNSAVSRLYADRGNAWVRLKDYDRALADFVKSIEVDPWGCDHHLSRVRPPSLLAAPIEFQTSYLQVANRAIELTGGSVDSYFSRSRIYLMLGKPALATNDLVSALKKNPEAKIPWSLRLLPKN